MVAALASALVTDFQSALTWDLSAKEAPEHIKANWPGSAWIVQAVTTTEAYDIPGMLALGGVHLAENGT